MQYYVYWIIHYFSNNLWCLFNHKLIYIFILYIKHIKLYNLYFYIWLHIHIVHFSILSKLKILLKMSQKIKGGGFRSPQKNPIWESYILNKCSLCSKPSCTNFGLETTSTKRIKKWHNLNKVCFQGYKESLKIELQVFSKVFFLASIIMIWKLLPLLNSINLYHSKSTNKSFRTFSCLDPIRR